MKHETNEPRKKRSDMICTPFGLIFRYGRKDCATSPITSLNRKFPNPHGNLHHTLKYFKNEFGFSARETVALMGAHALGMAHRGASGFDGRWSCGDYLVHKFYKDLVNAGHGWKQISLRSTKTHQGPLYQWVFSDNRRCFLNTDMSLYKKYVLILRKRQPVTVTTARVQPLPILLNFMLKILVHGSLISFQYFKK